ncbi:MAG: Mur ligase family protein [Endomicrobia bacterium]|nr:Mur ligase family protein [Endomicrobiia bacterium]
MEDAINFAKIFEKEGVDFYIELGMKAYNLITKKLFYTLTYFELLTCVMFLYFADTQPDFVILEVGLGGKLDATNVVPYSVISCITSISLDHIEVLGNTKIKILKDKAEIIKPDSVFICGVHDKRLQSYLIKRCRKLNTKFIYIPQDNISDIKMDMTKWKTTFLYKIDNKNIPFSLPVCSLIQPYNLVLALKIVEELHKFGFIKKIDYTKIINTVKRTTIPFRMQKFKFDGLTVVVDGAHNVDAVKNFVSTINLLPVNNIVICFTIMKEKDFKNVIKTLSLLDEKIEKFIVYKLETPRCQKLDRLYKEAVKYFNKKVLKFATPNELLNYIKKFCNHNKIFFVGSFYISSLFNK